MIVVLVTMPGAASGAGAPKDSLTIGLSSDASFLNALIASDGQSYKVEWSEFDCLVQCS